MNWPEIPAASGAGDRPPARRGIQLQGPRPTPLSVNKESRKIGKPPAVPKRPAPTQPPPAAPPPENRDPVIIYAVSPKVYHAEASDFMSVVQRLTGFYSSPTASTSAAAGPVSPAAKLAVLDRASPTGRNRVTTNEEESQFQDIMGWEEGTIDFGQIPGILSPAPANLPEVSAGMFPPVSEPQTLFGAQDNLMSPSIYGNYFIPSPNSSNLFPGSAIFSPTPSPVFDFSLFDF